MASYYPIIPISSCNSTLTLPSLATSLPSASIISLSAVPVLNYTATASSSLSYNHPTIEADNVNFCNVSITYTHPGQGDSITVETWLPIGVAPSSASSSSSSFFSSSSSSSSFSRQDDGDDDCCEGEGKSAWNGRLQAVGGGGWVSGRFPLSYIAMAGAVAEGYVAATTDAGSNGEDGETAYEPSSWAMVSEGNVNLYALQNLASVGLGDQAVIAKALTTSFYGQPPLYSYWSGCSQGGRQGLMLAQRYPDAYDGIAAAAPAIHWTEFFPGSLWAAVVMNWGPEESVPPGCEFEYITAAAVAFCDPLDGVVDGIISDDACRFDPFSVVGESFYCDVTGQERRVSETAALVANKTWEGPRGKEGKFLWYGPGLGARLWGDASGLTDKLGYVQTSCTNATAENGTTTTTCVPVPVGLGDSWFKYFVEKNSSWSWESLTPESFETLFHASVQEFDSMVGTSDPDLSQLREMGGKMITYHGLADGLIPYRDTVH